MSATLPGDPPPGAPPRPAGLVLAPFRGLRPQPDADLAAVLMPPYDVVDDTENDALATLDPHNAVRVVLPSDPAGEPGGRYAAAAGLLSAWRAQGALLLDADPALYVYTERLPGGHVQRGLLGALALSPAADAIVLPHEDTMAAPVADRLALLSATATDLEPIFLVYDGSGVVGRLVKGVTAEPPLAEATTADGTRHRLWAVTDPATLAAIAADLLPRRATIADGHHRYATYLRYQALQHAAGRGDGPWDSGLALLVDTSAEGPEVQAIHRVLPTLPLSVAVERASAAFTISALPDVVEGDAEPLLAAVGAAPGPAFVLSDGQAAWLLTGVDRTRLAAALRSDRSAAWRSLDVVVAHRLLVSELWGLADTEDVVGYAHAAGDALRMANATGGTALLLAPTPASAVAAVAAAGERMPRKSTLFTPKPATGLVLRPHDAAAG